MAATAKKTLQPAPLESVHFLKGFWADRIETNRNVTIPNQYKKCKDTGRIDAFKLDWKEGMPNKPHQFWDSDVAKWLEAAAYDLHTHPDSQIKGVMEDAIDLIEKAQQPDGYLNVWFSSQEPQYRWNNLRDSHELYCAGHLMEAAVAYHDATGDKKLLHTLTRYADHIAQTFGVEPGKRRGYCGHPEIELGLMKLHRATGEQKYLDLAKYFVDERGQSPYYFQVEADARNDKNRFWATPDYYQAHAPVRQQKDIEGHSVRALYLASGMLDVAIATNDKPLLKSCKDLWNSATHRRMYVTGGMGSSLHQERFTYDYDLPNETAYSETCATIALAFFAQRFLQLEPDREYGDVLERTLYNGILSGVSLSGDHFFYANPLAVHQAAHSKSAHEFATGTRKNWFGCACCPPNLARILASLANYTYSTSNSELYVHLFAASTFKTTLNKTPVELTTTTNYPWDADVNFQLTLPAQTNFTLAVRLPAWCAKPSLSINGKKINLKGAAVLKGYAKINRIWKTGDTVNLSLPMEITRVSANPHCRNDAGKVALQRGPIVYCLEQVDNGPDLPAIQLPHNSKLAAKFEKNLLGGIVTITGKALKLDPADWKNDLYRTTPSKKKPISIKAVPYCFWSNRKPGEMITWIREG